MSGIPTACVLKTRETQDTLLGPRQEAVTGAGKPVSKSREY